jgi:hypothetical protein
MKLYRLINKPVEVMVAEENLFTHRLLFKSNNVGRVIDFVRSRKDLDPDQLSVITTSGRGLTIFPYTNGSGKWMGW